MKRLIATWWSHGLKKQTIHNILTPLKEAYHHAMDEGLLTMNPVARTGRLTRTREDRRAHVAPLTAEEVRLLLRTAQAHLPALFPLLLCAVRTGLREGELIGLQWGDVDFQGRFLEVRRGIVRRQVTTTKSHKIRRVDLSPQLTAVLQSLAETRALEAGLTGQPRPDWVFLTPAGKRVSETTLRRAFYHCLDRAGLRRVRFHDLRHTYASLLIQQGAKPKYIQAQLGHGSIQVTMDIYGHLFEGDDRHVVSRLDDPPAEAVQDRAGEAKSATQPQPHLDTVETALA